MNTKRNGNRLAGVVLAAALLVTTLASAASANQQVLLGNSFASGDEATAEVNLKIANASAAGCKAISVGGYGLAGYEGGKEIGIPVLLDCPAGVDLLPNGQAVKRATGKKVGGRTYFEVDFSKGETGRSVCNAAGKRPSRFTSNSNVCRAFNPGARRFRLTSGDRAAAFCSGSEKGICSRAPNSCIECPTCTNGVSLDQDGSRLYTKMYVECR